MTRKDKLRVWEDFTRELFPDLDPSGFVVLANALTQMQVERLLGMLNNPWSVERWFNGPSPRTNAEMDGLRTRLTATRITGIDPVSRTITYGRPD